MRMTVKSLMAKYPNIIVGRAAGVKHSYNISCRPGYKFAQFSLDAFHHRNVKYIADVAQNILDIRPCTCAKCRKTVVRDTLNWGVTPAYLPADHPLLTGNMEAE